MRCGGAFASEAKAEPDDIASNQGRAMDAPAPRRNRRRGICHFLLMILGRYRVYLDWKGSLLAMLRIRLIIRNWGLAHVLAELLDDLLVGDFEAASQSVGEEFLRQAAAEVLLLFQHEAFEIIRPRKGGAVGQFPTRVDGLGHISLVSSPGTDGVIVLETEAKWINLAMATGAGRVLAVFDHAFSQGQGDLSFLVGLDLASIGRGRGRRIAQEILQNPDTTFDGFRTRSIGETCQNTGVSHDPTTMRIRGETDPAKGVALDSLNSIVTRQPFIDDREIGIDEIKHAEIVVEDFREESFRFLDHGSLEMVVIFRVKFFVWWKGTDQAGLEPLTHKTLHESLGLPSP